jgi:L-asparaginase
MDLPAVNVYVLGGTITMAPGTSGITPKLTGEDLTAGLPALRDLARLNVQTPFLKPGASLAMTEIAQVAQEIAADTQADGSVVVQGTDTIDETSFLLQLLYNGDAPLVVTGAMRGAAAPGADGPANLTAAITTAASKHARGHGVLVVLNDEIHHASTVEKMHKGLTSAFQSPGGGPLGYCLEGTVRLVRSNRATAWPHFAPARFGKIAIVKVSLDDEPDLLQALPGLGYEGAVIEAMGAGHTPAKWVPALEAIAGKMPVVLASRVLGGPVFRNTYGFPGSEIDLLRRGLICAGWLSPHKARLLLSVAVGAGLDGQGLKTAFAAFD